MKKVFGLVLLLLFAKNLAAQDENGTGFEGALRATPIFMWTKVDVENSALFTAKNDKLKPGFAYGIMVDYFFAPNAGISSELRIAHLGAAFSVTDVATDTTKSQNFRLQYVEIPVSLKMRTKEVGYMKYYGQFGLMPSINIKAKRDEVAKSGNSTKETTDISASKDVVPIGLSLVIGAGTTYNLGGSTSLMGGISFHNGFTNMVKKDKFDAMIKPAYIALNLGVIF